MKIVPLLFVAPMSFYALAAEELPANLSREPNCIEGTFCMSEDAIYIPSTVPEGFSREPSCLEQTICVPEHMYMLHEDFVAIREVVELTFGARDLIVQRIEEVMSGIVHVRAVTTNYNPANDGGGADYLVEKQDDKWVVLREQNWVI